MLMLLLLLLFYMLSYYLIFKLFSDQSERRIRQRCCCFKSRRLTSLHLDAHNAPIKRSIFSSTPSARLRADFAHHPKGRIFIRR